MDTLKLILLSSEFIENKEGVVITFDNGKMAKCKSDFYMSLHGLLTDGLQEHKLVSKILNEEIDDVLAFIPVDAIEEREYINGLTSVIINHVNNVATEAFNTFNAEYNGDRKSFAMKFKDHPLFNIMSTMFKTNSYESVEKSTTQKVIFDCRKLAMARRYIKSLGFNRVWQPLEDTSDTK